MNSQKALEFSPADKAVWQAKATGDRKQRWKLQKHKDAYYIINA